MTQIMITITTASTGIIIIIPVIAVTRPLNYSHIKYSQIDNDYVFRDSEYQGCPWSQSS